VRQEDIIDSLEYIEDEFIEEADRARNAGKPSGDSGKITPVRRRPVSARKWGSLAASLAVLAVAAFVLTGILRTRSGNMDAMKSAEAVAVGEDQAEQEEERIAFEKADAYAADKQGAEAEMNAEPETAAEAEVEMAAEAEAPAEADMEMAAETEVEMAAEAPAEMDMAAEAEARNEADKAGAAVREPVTIRVSSEAGEIVFALNDTPAAKSLAAQLPLSTDTEPYSDNEIVFHPEEPLDTENGVEGGGSAGYLGYFAPWNNVVMYYGDFDEYPGLYILGEAVSGAEYIKDITGTITIECLQAGKGN